MTDESEMPYSLQNGISCKEDGKDLSCLKLKTDPLTSCDSPVILNQTCLNAHESELQQQDLNINKTDGREADERTKDLEQGEICELEKGNTIPDIAENVNSHENLSEEDAGDECEKSFEINSAEENHSTGVVINDFDNLDNNEIIGSDASDLDISCQGDVVNVLVSEEADLSSPSIESNIEDGNWESSQDLLLSADKSSDQNSLIVVSSDGHSNDCGIHANIDLSLNKIPADSESTSFGELSESSRIASDLKVGGSVPTSLEEVSANRGIPEQGIVDECVPTISKVLLENTEKSDVEDSAGEGSEGQSSVNPTESSQLSAELVTPSENLESDLNSQEYTCDTEETSEEALEVGEDLTDPDSGDNNLEYSLEKEVEIEDLNMGKKSGSFSKKNGSLYVYSKDEFKESYENKPKPKAATLFSRSPPKGKGTNKPKAPPRRFSEHDTPASSSEGIPPQGSTDRSSHSSSPRLEQSPARSPEVRSGTPSSSERTSHSHVTVELLSSNRNSLSHATPESIDHSFVVTANNEAEECVSMSSQAKKDEPSPDAEGGPEDIGKATNASQAESGPPAPRLSILSSSSTHSTPKSPLSKTGAENHAQQDEQSEVGTVTMSSPPVSPQPVLQSPKVAKSPELSEIMCITRTVDGEEELILGAGPMFANQQKLTMESAIAQDVSKSLLAQDRASMAALEDNSHGGPKGFKNYACIEPVGVPIESQAVVQEPKVKDTKESSEMKEGKQSETVPLENGLKEEDKVFLNGDVKKQAASDGTKNKSDNDDGGLDEDEDDDDDDDAGINDAAYHISDWMYLGSGKELSMVTGKEGDDLTESIEDLIEEEGESLKASSGLHSSNSMDSLDTTPSEKEFKNHYPSLSLRRIKREGSVLGYRKLTDITREREVVIAFDEKAKSYGFRIQYSKPAIVTEVDTGGAAEQRGLRVGDVILGVNGTDVRKAPHATVVKLVQTGPPEVRLLVGTNMCNSPNQDLYKPIKTGYMHKLGGQGMLKNWKKRWFVLKHDGCLYYYKTKDEVDPLGAVVLTNYTLFKARDAGKQHAFKISKYKARTYYFYTETEEDMNSWAKAITEAAQKKTNADVWLDISTHNVGLPALSIKNPDCRGFLTKQGNVHKSWKKRYCVLKDACMYYYIDMKQPQALGIVHFHGYKIQETELAGKKHGFILEPPIPQLRTYYFIAENETERKRWVASLATSIGRWIQTNEEDEFSKEENKDEEMLI